MEMPSSGFSTTAAHGVAALLFFALLPAAAHAQAPAPTREVAIKCQRMSYEAYPLKRVGSVKGSPDRGNFYRDCVAKNGQVELPEKK